MQSLEWTWIDRVLFDGKIETDENGLNQIDVSNENILPHSMIYRVVAALPATLGSVDPVKRCSCVCLVYHHCSRHDSEKRNVEAWEQERKND